MKEQLKYYIAKVMELLGPAGLYLSAAADIVNMETDLANVWYSQ